MRKNKDFEQIRNWAENKGIYKSGDPMTQFAKLSEEQGELAQALLKEDRAGVIDAIGDMVVVLTNLAELSSDRFCLKGRTTNKRFTIETCISHAWEEIKDRTGKMENGSFVKDK